MVASDSTLEGKQYVLFLKILTPSEKPFYAAIYSLFEIPGTEIFLNNLLQTLGNLIVRRVT